MNIENNIIKHYLRNRYFLNGTAYAGKSTMCRMLAEKYNMIHCGENYNLEMILKVADMEKQPNLTYFRRMKNWQEYVSRTPDEFESWYLGNQYEVAQFEIAELIKLSGDRKIIVDTNIPCDILKKITDYNQVAIMLSPQSMSVDNFFNRDDEEKQFLLSEIRKTENPEKTLANFKACIARVNSKEHYDEFLNSGFFTYIREDTENDTREQTMNLLAEHFGLNKQEK